MSLYYAFFKLEKKYGASFKGPAEQSIIGFISKGSGIRKYCRLTLLCHGFLDNSYSFDTT